MIRIIGGVCRGRRVEIPPGALRPATARVRQSLFDYLSAVIPGSRILDLFCGSGVLGFEALSRGATFACFVDRSPAVIETVSRSAISLRLDSFCELVTADVFEFLSGRGNGDFDVVFAAPPYAVTEPKRILTGVRNSKMINQDGLVCLEYSRHTEPPEMEVWSLERRGVYGETVVEVWGVA